MLYSEFYHYIHRKIPNQVPFGEVLGVPQPVQPIAQGAKFRLSLDSFCWQRVDPGPLLAGMACLFLTSCPHFVHVRRPHFQVQQAKRLGGARLPAGRPARPRQCSVYLLRLPHQAVPSQRRAAPVSLHVQSSGWAVAAIALSLLAIRPRPAPNPCRNAPATPAEVGQEHAPPGETAPPPPCRAQHGTPT